MCSIIRVFVDRLKALFLMQAVVELGADLAVVCAGRQVELLRRADQYEKEGSPATAQQLRRLAELLTPKSPQDSNSTIAIHLQSDQTARIDSASSPQSDAATLTQTKPQILIDFDRAVRRHFRAVLGPLTRASINRLVRHGVLQSRLAIVNMP